MMYNNVKKEKKIIISTIIISIILLCSIFIGIKVFSNSHEEIKIDDELLPDVSTTWYKDYTYTKDDSAKTITLTKYNKAAANVVVPKSATISGTTLTTVISGGVFRDNTSIKSVEFQSGVKADTTLAYLFSGCSNLESVNFNKLNTSKVTNMAYMFADTKITDIDISSFKTTNVENFVYIFDSVPLKKIKLGNIDFKINSLSGYPFGRGTWIREEDGKEYAAADLAIDSSTKDISGTYRKVRNIIDEMSVNGDVTYKFNEFNGISEFETTNTSQIGLYNNQYVYIKNLPSSNKSDYKVAGTTSVLIKNAITDVNNNKYHLKVTLNNLHLYDLEKAGITENIYGRLMKISANRLYLQNGFYKTFDDMEAGKNSLLKKATTSVDVTFEILNQNNEPVNGTFNFSAYDLDTPSPRDGATGLPSRSAGQGYGDYSEGINLIEGYDFDSLKLFSRTSLKVKNISGNKRIYGTHIDNGSELTEMVIKANAKKFKFTWTGNTCGTGISSYYQPQRVEFVKQNEKGELVTGAKLSVYDNTNTLVSSWTTTNESKYLLLNPGKYTLKEETTPNGYEKANDIKFYVDIDGSVIINNATANKIVMTDKLKKYPYTVNYLDKETKKPIHDPKTVENILFGTKIKSKDEVINITNYKYDSTDKEELTINVNDNVINLYYNRIKGGVIEKHIDEVDNKILYEEEHTLPVGDEYNIPSKTFENYVLNEDRLPTNATGTVREESQEVIYYYRRIVNVITKVTNEGGTIVGDEEVLEEKDSTPNKIVIKADDNHYIEKVTINGEEIEITDNKEMILENFKSMKEDKIVEVSFGEIIKEVPKTDKNTILPIISIIVLAVGMLIVIIQSKKFKKN